MQLSKLENDKREGKLNLDFLKRKTKETNKTSDNKENNHTKTFESAPQTKSINNKQQGKSREESGKLRILNESAPLKDDMKMQSQKVEQQTQAQMQREEIIEVNKRGQHDLAKTDKGGSNL